MRNLKQVRHPSGPARRAARIKARASSEESEAVSSRHELLLQGWACAFTGATITYVSGPISTGPRFVEWYRAAGHLLERESQKYKKALRTFVIEPNSRDIIDAAVRLRRELREPVLEPASLNVSDWSASDYHALWVQVIERFAERIVVMPGWEYSAGCAAELHRAFTRGVRVETLEGLELTLETAANALRLSAEELERERVPVPLVLEKSIALTRLYRSRLSRPEPLHTIEDDAPKDVALNILAELINVAQFISFSPRANRKSEQRFSRILGHSPNAKFTNHLLALEKLLETSGSGSINLPSYTPADPQSREFIYGLRSIDDAVSAFERLANEGLWIIANETIDVHDGGVSGVIMGDVIEFAPDDTPRSVERPGITSLPREQGLAILGTVYGFSPDLNVPRASRLEFSIHPMPCGWRRGHTLGWEFAAVDPSGITASFVWPNRFSQMLGDKVFGLLIAHHNGLPVPRSTVINRRVAPFSFGHPTGSAEVWLRTSPREQEPGRFTTTKGWVDPFALLAREDPEGNHIASVICQAGIPAEYSGAAIVSADGRLVIEGKRGQGEQLMKGEMAPEQLPPSVQGDIGTLFQRAERLFGKVRFEWVHDGNMAWIVQLHRGQTVTHGGIIVPGEPARWVIFDVARGLSELRRLLEQFEPGSGLLLRGRIGLTSHIADVLRRSNIPARIEQDLR